VISPQDINGVVIIAGFFALILLLAEIWTRLLNPKPEVTRKFVHLFGGMVCLTFPFLIESILVVLILAVTMSALFTCASIYGFLPCLHRVKRKSLGSEYYPLAIFIVFCMSFGKPWLYVVSILVLAVSDAFAALIGSRYGQIHYEVEDKTKSLEGSAVFALTAFPAIYLPMLLMTDLPGTTCFFSALLVAGLVTGFEAIALSGTDNIFVPVAVCAILARISTKELDEIIFQNISFWLLAIAVFMMSRMSKNFNTGGTIAFLLFTYGAWSLGNVIWGIPVFLAFAVYTLIRKIPVANDAGLILKVRVVSRALLVPLLILIIANVSMRQVDFYAPFLVSCSLILAFTIQNRFSGNYKPLAVLVFSIPAVCVTIPLIVWFLLEDVPISGLLWVWFVIAVGSCFKAALSDWRPVDNIQQLWKASHMIISLAAAALIYILQLIHWASPWVH